MAIESQVSTRVSTPLSSTATLSVPPSPDLKGNNTDIRRNGNPLVAASAAIEYIASSNSSSIFVYDLAEQAGFGAHTKSWAETSKETGLASVVSLQTRAGAGLSLAGRLSQGSSKDAAHSAVLTAYTTPTGLAAMVQSFSYLPTASATGRLVLQVPNVTPVGQTFALSPTLAPFTPSLPLLPENITLLLSASPQEAVDLATLSYALNNTHVAHVFDHHSSAREIGHSLIPSLPAGSRGLSLKDGLKLAGYNYFDYVGDENATSVIVLLNGPLAVTAKALASRASGLGVVIVRVLRPWDEDALSAVIPSTARCIHVLDDVPSELTQGALYTDVLSALINPIAPGPIVKPHRVTPTCTQNFLTAPQSFIEFIQQLAPNAAGLSLEVPNQKKLLFYSTPGSPLSTAARAVEQTFLTHPSISARLLTDHDALSRPKGITADRIIISTKSDAVSPPMSVAIPIATEGPGSSDFIAVLDESLLKSHTIATNVKSGSPLLVVTSWTPPELAANLSAEALATIRDRKLHLYTIGAEKLASDIAGAAGPQLDVVQNVIVLFAILRLYLGKAASEDIVLKLSRRFLGDVIQGFDLAKIGARAWAGLVEIEVPEPAEDAVSGSPLNNFEFNAVVVETEDGNTVVNGARLSSWHDAAKHIIFPSAFNLASVTSSTEQNPSLHPELPERTFLITTTVNRRLTPLDYNRNVFHIEFDTRGTGLKYAIGEALGVHGWNDEQEIIDFCAWYGVDPNRLVTIPIPGTDGTKMHTRTAFQALQQQIDLFGKPGKSFYTELAAFATSKADKYALLFIGSPEGSATFKKLSEKDTVTFADVLQKYESARPGIEVLCELVGDIKPRHYSIASSQAVVGDRVDLLVVAVDWVTPSGSPRYGQCTRYLASLKIGQKVTVSIKPSVMKLPPDNTQPIIMAGLGTGAAPFRAFLQYRASLAAQNIPIGPTYYYFGSRHRHQEYLYGEEIEAFLLDGVLTKAGLAFSRDGKDKVYIQHKMREDGPVLVDMLRNKKGVFYLCGPTWPVPDVYEALVDALVQSEGMEATAAGAFLEGLKEEERYVLEVY